MRRYKVIIVGGGPAGAMAALSLVRLRPGLAGDMLLLEAKPFPREKICGGGVGGRVVACLEELGVSLQGLPRVPVNGLTVYFARRKTFHPFGNDRCFVTRRSAFDHLLLKEVEERGVEVRTATPAVGAYLERRGVAVLDRDGNIYHAQVLVGADGVDGRSRTWFGLPHGGRKSLLLQTHIPRDPASGFPQGSMVMDFSPRQFGVPGYVWLFPCLGEEGEPLYNAGISGGGFRRGDYARLRKAFLSVLDRHAELRGAASPELRFKAHAVRDYSPFQAPSRERVIYVGDQLGVDCITGEGLSICAESAVAASQEVVEALEGGDYTFRGYARRLRKCEFFPVYLVGRPFWIQRLSQRPSFLFSLATCELPPGKENVLDIYVRVYAGDIPAGTLFSSHYLEAVLRGFAGSLGGRLREASGTSPSAR